MLALYAAISIDEIQNIINTFLEGQDTLDVGAASQNSIAHVGLLNYARSVHVRHFRLAINLVPRR